MRKHGEGAWVETAAHFSEGLPVGPGRREALIARCNEEGRNERVISRMISAREYARKWIDEDELRASHTAVELLRTLETANASKAASIRIDVLQGKVSRPQLDLIIKDIRNESEARSTMKLSLTIEEVVNICRKQSPFIDKFELIAPPRDEKGTMLGADMEFSFDDAEEGKDGVMRRTYEPRWALVVSPHVSCSRIFGVGLKGFVLSTMALSWCYPKVSAFCTSHIEARDLMNIIKNSNNSVLVDRIITHLPTK